MVKLNIQTVKLTTNGNLIDESFRVICELMELYHEVKIIAFVDCVDNGLGLSFISLYIWWGLVLNRASKFQKFMGKYKFK